MTGAGFLNMTCCLCGDPFQIPMDERGLMDWWPALVFDGDTGRRVTDGKMPANAQRRNLCIPCACLVEAEHVKQGLPAAWEPFWARYDQNAGQ